MSNWPKHGPEILLETDLFAGLPRETLFDLAGHCDWREIDAGHLLIDAATRRPHGVFILAAGDVEVFHDDAGSTLPVARLAAVDCFGEFAAIRGEPGSASVRSLSPCRLGEMPANVFTALLAARTCFSMRVLRRVVATVTRLDEAIIGVHRRTGSEHDKIRELYRDLAVRSL